MNLNKHLIIGRLGKDPDLRYASSGMAVANFSVATNWYKKLDNGEFETNTVWHDVTAFGNNAEKAGEFLKKGSEVYIEGEIRQDSWEDKEGNKRYKKYTIANVLQLGARPDSGNGNSSSTKPISEPKAKAESVINEHQIAKEPEPEEDDLPF